MDATESTVQVIVGRARSLDGKPDLFAAGLQRAGERYIWLWTEDRKSDMQRSLGRFATCEDLSFTWWDAACIAKQMRELYEQKEQELVGPGPRRMRS